MDSDFKSWYLENGDFFAHLHGHGTILFSHVKDIIDALAYISDMNEEELDSDLVSIFDSGYAYLYSYVSELKLYLKNYFNDNFHKFLDYDTFLSYNFYINDIKELLVNEERYSDDIRKEFEWMLSDIENVLKEQKDIDETKIDEYNTRMLAILPDNEDYETLPEIFHDVVDRLKL